VTQFDASKNVIRVVSQNRLPAIYPGRQFVEAGGLVSYFANPSDQGRQVAAYLDKILKGAKPGDLPVEQYTSYELTVNLRGGPRRSSSPFPPALLKEAADVFR
jgi:putative ABC transport system substrate-binding protein